MQVADIISWSLGRFACFHKREVAVCVFCVCVRACMLVRERERKERGGSKEVVLQFVVSDKLKDFYIGMILVHD